MTVLQKLRGEVPSWRLDGTVLTLGGGLILKNFGGFYAIYAFPIAEIITFVFVAVLIFKGKANSEKIIKSALPLSNAV